MEISAPRLSCTTEDLIDDERDSLIGLLSAEIEASKFQLSPRIERAKRIRAKLVGEPIASPEPPSRRPI